jgi:hypothetical protein
MSSSFILTTSTNYEFYEMRQLVSCPTVRFYGGLIYFTSPQICPASEANSSLVPKERAMIYSKKQWLLLHKFSAALVSLYTVTGKILVQS